MSKTPDTRPSSWCGNHIVSLSLYILLTVHFFAFVTPLLWNYSYSMPICTAAFIIITIVLVAATYSTCMTDPVDDAVAWKDFNRSPQYGTQLSYCHACKVDVHSSSRHCRYCDKCVIGFDHHCSWLNVCIGSKNYAFFLTTCCMLALATTISLVLCITYLTEFCLDPNGNFLHRYERSILSSAMSIHWVVAVLVISTFVLLPFVLSLYHIIGFHIMLASRGMTTYDYVVEKHRQARRELTSKSKRASTSSDAPANINAELQLELPPPESSESSA